MCILNEKPLFAATGITKNYSIKLNYFWCIKHYESKHFKKHILVSEFWLVFKLWTRTLLLKISFKKFDFKMYLNFAHWGKVSCISKPRYSLIKTVWFTVWLRQNTTTCGPSDTTDKKYIPINMPNNITG